MMNFGEGEAQIVEFSPAFPYQAAFFLRTSRHPGTDPLSAAHPGPQREKPAAHCQPDRLGRAAAHVSNDGSDAATVSARSPPRLACSACKLESDRRLFDERGVELQSIANPLRHLRRGHGHSPSCGGD